ncbi:hypothetical protein CALVIDRAFT_132833 [Calocera viscosa TUFC12733]|uniref:Uncharacterized protein n=1 Tax=Calocera viscosa (strain TUFC12733) TaxID=1330018 RepID=A0A167RVY7_CALVF|nr:hypothetical protein CALVIDRAFT_132833 [Calocera viscosa TUFC12733]
MTSQHEQTLSEHILSISRHHVRVSHSALVAFSRSLAAVVTGLRVAYLLDISLDALTAEALLGALRQVDALFHTTVFLQTAAGEQTFFLNTCLLDERSVLDDKIWLRLSGGTVEKSCHPPDTVLSALTAIRSTVLGQPSALCRLSDYDAATLVAVAGALLEYPIVYVPSPDLYLLHVEVFTCKVILQGKDEHVLLQFSYPTTFAETPTIRTAAHEATLTDRYTKRLQKTKSEWSGIRVEFNRRFESRLSL